MFPLPHRSAHPLPPFFPFYVNVHESIGWSSDKLNCTYVFYRPGWPIPTVVLRERRTSELCLQRPNALLICAKTPKRGMTSCAPSARLQASPPGLWSYANSTPSLLCCRTEQRCFLNVILRRSFCRLKLHPPANSWHILPAWKICCCLSTLGMRPAIRFPSCFLCGVVGLWYLWRFISGLRIKPEGNSKENTTLHKAHAI